MRRVGIVCDLREEGWHSMDLVADMLLERLPVVAGADISAARLCPPMTRRWSRVPVVGRTRRARLADRLTGRLWDYPRWLRARTGEFDCFHIVDHSYAHLVRVLPPDRTIVTCHDLDAVEAALRPSGPLSPSRWLAAPILEGLSRAAHVACVTEATRTELLATGCVQPDRVSVVHEGVHPSCVPAADAQADADIARRLGAPGLEILHVGSTIPRKRIDRLLWVLRGLRERVGPVTLLRVGGPLTPAQRALAESLGVAAAVVELPFLERPALAALYRRAALVVLPSDREGFGLPLAEAMACGTPVVASAIPALREVGGHAASFCAPDNADEWVETIARLLQERASDPAAWQQRKQACLAAVATFNWTTYAAGMAARYLAL